MKNALAVYKGRERMIPGSLNMVRSSKGVQMVLTIDSREAGRLLFIVPFESETVDRNTVNYSVLGDFVLEAKEFLTFDVIRLSLFIDGEYRQALHLNGMKMIENIALAKDCTITIRADKQSSTQVTDYISVLEAPNVPMG
jgi:hypothetical protein